MTEKDKKLKKQREYRQKTGNICTIKYERTLKGHAMRTYRNMLSRVRGIQKKGRHLYYGLPILDKYDFYEWTLNDRDYIFLWEQWVECGYQQKLTPSIDRIDPKHGYELWNIRWLTHSENSSLSNNSRRERAEVA